MFIDLPCGRNNHYDLPSSLLSLTAAKLCLYTRGLFSAWHPCRPTLLGVEHYLSKSLLNQCPIRIPDAAVGLLANAESSITLWCSEFLVLNCYPLFGILVAEVGHEISSAGCKFKTGEWQVYVKYNDKMISVSCIDRHLFLSLFSLQNVR